MDTLLLLLPELILLLAAATVFIADLASRRQTNDNVLVSISIAGLVLAAVSVIFVGGADPAAALNMLAVDGFALFLKVIVFVGMVLVVLLSMDYMKKRAISGRGEFYAMLLSATLAISLAAGANDLLMVYLSMEFLSITSYVLAGFLRGDAKSNEAGVKYFIYGSVASGVMLYGISLLFGMAGTTSLPGVAEALSATALQGGSLGWLGGLAAIVLLLVGFGFKVSLVPFHQWAPDTYEGAPTPITGFLSTASKAAGFALLIRTFVVALPGFSLHWQAFLAGLSLITMTFGNLVALRQTEIKRLLAYSSIAQAGYILIGVAAIPQSSLTIEPFPGITFGGVQAVLFYLFGYLFTNLGAFAVVIAFENATGSTQLKDYAGLIRRAPALAALMLIFLLSLAGIPPTLGFWGKYFVFGSAIDAGLAMLAIAGLINAVIAAGYYLNVVRYMFLMKPETDEPVKQPPALTVVLAISGIAVLLFGMLPNIFIEWAGNSVEFLTRL